MKVVVTGGSGLLGRHVLAELASHGYELLNADRVLPEGSEVPTKLVNMEDLGQLFGCLEGAEAVVHLAAIPRPTFHTNEVVFRTNVLGTYHLFEAAAQLRIPRIVWASSVSVLGYPFNYHRFAPAYLPIDEEHPCLPQDPYALSKRLGEEMADAFVRRSGATIVSLRFPWIHTPATFREQLLPMQAEAAAGATNLWAYIDARDAASALRLALEAELQGHERFFVAAPDTFMPIPSVELVSEFYPESRIRAGFGGNDSLLSSERAARMLGWGARHRWASYLPRP